MPQDVSGAQAHTCRTPRLGPPGQSWLRHVALPWLTSAGWRGFAVVAVVLLQFAVPLLALLLPPPTRFGFQMYSGRVALRSGWLMTQGNPTRFRWTVLLRSSGPN